MKIKSIMISPTMLTMDSSWTVSEVLKCFRSMNQEYISITDRGRFIGLITKDRVVEYIEKASLNTNDLSKIPASAVIGFDTTFCCPENHLIDIFKVMSDKGLNYIAVKSMESIVGVVSFSLLSAVVRHYIWDSEAITDKP